MKEWWEGEGYQFAYSHNSFPYLLSSICFKSCLMWRNVLSYKRLEDEFTWWVLYRLESNCKPKHSGYRYNFRNICLWLQLVELLPYEWASQPTQRWTSHFAHHCSFMIINSEGYNDDDYNNNTINNWHEEQSRQKVLLLGEIHHKHLVHFLCSHLSRCLPIMVCQVECYFEDP